MKRRSLLSLLVGLVVLSCSDPSSPATDVTGIWRLQTVNGKALPFILTEPGVDKLELMAEEITLTAPGRVTMSTTFRITDHGNVSSESDPDTGTYTANGSTVSFRFDSDGSTPIGIITGNTMSLDDIGLTFVYRRD